MRRVEIEKEEAGGSELRVSSGLQACQVGGVEAGLEDVLQARNRQIMALEDEVKEWKGRFKRMMSEFEHDFQTHGLPMPYVDEGWWAD